MNVTSYAEGAFSLRVMGARHQYPLSSAIYNLCMHLTLATAPVQQCIMPFGKGALVCSVSSHLTNYDEVRVCVHTLTF